MIVYHTAPIRCFPLLVEQMGALFRNSYHFRMPIRAADEADHRFGMLNHVIAYDWSLTELPRRSVPDNGFPYDILRNGIDFVDPASLEPIDFLYGVFDGDLIDKQDGDFVFTILSEPVRHIYDLFDYLSFVNRTATAEDRVAEGVALFDEIVAAGAERFVDRFLAGDHELVVGGRSFFLIEDFFRFNPRVDYDFVGTENRVAEAVAELSRRLGVEIRPSARLLARGSSIVSRSNYRYEDLRRILRDEVEAYQSFAAR